MGEAAISRHGNLPAYDTLTTIEKLYPYEEINWTTQDLTRLEQAAPHLTYLEHPVYDDYFRMHKVLVGEGGAKKLIEIGNELQDEVMPEYLNVAGWSFAEAALAQQNATAVSRVELIERAEEVWTRAMVSQLQLADLEQTGNRMEVSAPHRLALNLAFTPLMKSIVVGNVTRGVRERTVEDVLALGNINAKLMAEALESGDKHAPGEFIGLLHEENALLTMLHMDDPHYVPLPAPARADSGYYYPEQTHDIWLVNQHWGRIKKILPIEIKSAASVHDKQRYKALIIRGKMHLAVEGKYDPRFTLAAFEKAAHHEADTEAWRIVEHATYTVRDLLRLYQQGVSPEMVAFDSLTRFHDVNQVEREYPELSRTPRPSKKQYSKKRGA